MQDKTYEDRLRCLRLWTLEERRNRQDLIDIFKMYRGLSNVLLHELFTLDENSKDTRGHLCKLVKPAPITTLAEHAFLRSLRAIKLLLCPLPKTILYIFCTYKYPRGAPELLWKSGGDRYSRSRVISEHTYILTDIHTNRSIYIYRLPI